ncbi:acyl carrier protein [uncultured Treponema sp.]|uniref:acyl carrier protein n=1 Tax=uncultured Treponema sp. TaxID=162155 RepID=UPI0025FE35A3|nr:acyl carrier protein [uncultured Treponema sp.]MBQ7538381.1 acyl carrier protein [Treponema sp.]
MTKDEIYAKLKETLVNDFDIEEADIKPEANIGVDLDLDSIDAVELIVKMKPYIDGKIEPELFKSVKTVQDVVNILEPLTK